MTSRFAQRNVIVTGGGRGIGRSIALAFAHEGANVLITGRSEEALEQTAVEIHDAGGQAWWLSGSIHKPEDVAAHVGAAMKRWGRIDVLVNNSAAIADTPFLQIDEREWQHILNVNLTGTFLMSQAVCREMARTGGGAVIIMSSIDAFGADGSYAAYNTSKAGLLGLARTMALELAVHNIRVNAVCPGFTHTKALEESVASELVDRLVNHFERAPMRRLVRPDEVAAACLFLASKEASAITGTSLNVDCGVAANLFILETLEDNPPPGRTS